MRDHSSTISQNNPEANGEMSKVFKKKVEPFSKSIFALHPHFYDSSLYNRASELKALKELVGQMQEAARLANSHSYKGLSSLLEDIKDTLNGNPNLSWWNLFAVTLGNTLTAQVNEEEKNTLEFEYLSQIASLLTEIIRHYKSSDTKLLLDIRLTALEVDSRIIELEKMPRCLKESNETLDYLCSEFRLLIAELDALQKTDRGPWQTDITNLLNYTLKINQLMRILKNVTLSNPEIYSSFIKKALLSALENKVVALIQQTLIISRHIPADIWNYDQLNTLFELFSHFPATLFVIDIFNLTSLLLKAESLFILDTSPSKQRPDIFSSQELIYYVSTRNNEFSKTTQHLIQVSKGKEDREISKDPISFFKKCIKDENDLYNICTMSRFSPETLGQSKNPAIIQSECMGRMRLITASSQPRYLDFLLKELTHEQLESRYSLLQEIILEQFIRWRKQGIY